MAKKAGIVVDLTEDHEELVASSPRNQAKRKQKGIGQRSDSVIVVGPAFSPPPSASRKRKASKAASPAPNGAQNSMLVDLTDIDFTPPRRRDSGLAGSGSGSGASSRRERDKKVKSLHDDDDDTRSGNSTVGKGKAPGQRVAEEVSPAQRRIDLLNGSGGCGVDAGGRGKAKAKKDEAARESEDVRPLSHSGGEGSSSGAARRRPAAGASGTCASCGQVDGAVRTQCGHLVCKACMASALFHPSKYSSGPSGGKGMQREPLERARDCEACGSKFTEHDMLAFFPREEVDKVVLQATLAFLDAEPSCVKCPKEGCGARIMLNAEASAKNISRIAPDGQSLTKAAAKHMAENRIRCPDCSTNFCSSCMAAPYHVTFTCQEYKERQAARPCRFCCAPLPPGSRAGAVCGDADCKQALKGACDVRHQKCLHWCLGVYSEDKCMPCIECSKDADEFCNVCWTDALRASPVIKLSCNHLFHLKCIKERLDKRWPTAKINFNFAKCPLCRVWVDHPQVAGDMKSVKALMKRVEGAAVERLRLENGHKDKAALAKHGGSEAALAMSKYNYYMCSKCSKPYFGGMAACGDAVAGGDEGGGGAGGGGGGGGGAGGAGANKKDELMCGKCSGAMLGMKGMDCAKHGTQYVEFKCRYCCDVATFFCFGHTHFCETCHKKWVAGAYQRPASLVQKCKCKVKHAVNGTTAASEACFGCSLCRIKVAESAPI